MTARILDSDETRCWRCSWYNELAPLEDENRFDELGSCENKESEHFGHVLTDLHPSCKRFI